MMSQIGSLLDFLTLSQGSTPSPVRLVEPGRPSTTTTGHRRFKSMEETYPYKSKGFDARTRDSRPLSVNIEHTLSTLHTGFQVLQPASHPPKRPYSQITSRIESFRPKLSKELATPNPAKRRQNMMRSELM
jgi:hypothetical protein